MVHKKDELANEAGVACCVASCGRLIARRWYYQAESNSYACADVNGSSRAHRTMCTVKGGLKPGWSSLGFEVLARPPASLAAPSGSEASVEAVAPAAAAEGNGADADALQERVKALEAELAAQRTESTTAAEQLEAAQAEVATVQEALRAKTVEAEAAQTTASAAQAEAAESAAAAATAVWLTFDRSMKTRPYHAHVRRGGEKMSLGHFATAEEAALVLVRDAAAQAAAATQPPATSSKKRKVKSEEQPPDMPAGSRVKLEEVPPPMPNDAVVKVE